MDVSAYEHIVQCTFQSISYMAAFVAHEQDQVRVRAIAVMESASKVGDRRNKPTTITEDEKHIPN